MKLQITIVFALKYKITYKDFCDILFLGGMKMIIGSHVSFKKDQLLGSVNEALSYGANAFMFYTGAPQNTMRAPIDDECSYLALTKMKEHGIDLNNVICHAPYIINLANNSDPEKYEFSINFLKKELERCKMLQVKYIVLHPGSAVKHDKVTAINNIINALNKAISLDDNVMILLETMAGKGTEIGSKMEELATIIKNVNLKEHIGVCLDTCHLNDAGVDLTDFDRYLELFDKYIGIDKIKCIHINDSKNEKGAHKDRHENIGFGTIGFTTLLNIINHPKLKDVPKILETPYINDKAPYKEEIKMLKDGIFNANLIEDVINN